MSRRWYVRAAAVTGATVCALAMGVPIASADASGDASCIGLEASAISPPGSLDEFPGGMAEATSFVRDTFGKVGPAASFVARIHAGSHQACDEATE
jgi:hypothetical protein